MLYGGCCTGFCLLFSLLLKFYCSLFFFGVSVATFRFMHVQIIFRDVSSIDCSGEVGGRSDANLKVVLSHMSRASLKFSSYLMELKECERHLKIFE